MSFGDDDEEVGELVLGDGVVADPDFGASDEVEVVPFVGFRAFGGAVYTARWLEIGEVLVVGICEDFADWSFPLERNPACIFYAVLGAGIDEEVLGTPAQGRGSLVVDSDVCVGLGPIPHEFVDLDVLGEDLGCLGMDIGLLQGFCVRFDVTDMVMVFGHA